MMSPKRAPSARVGRDRFTAESYTILGESTQTYCNELQDNEELSTLRVFIQNLLKFSPMSRRQHDRCRAVLLGGTV